HPNRLVSAVTTIALAPAAVARRTNDSASASSLGQYSWYHQGSAISATSSIGVEAAVDNTIGTPTELAPRATAVSASWWTCSSTPIGAVNRGVGYCSPKRVMPRSPALSESG